MPLTPHQQEKHDEAIALYKQGHKRVILEGSAGTGKTTTADQIVKTIKKDHTINPNYNNGTIQVCAPTNKALAVIKTRVTSAVEFKTVHSGLRLRQFTHPKSGIETFVQQKQYGRPKGNEFDKAKFVLIDECSMLGKSLEGSAPHMETDPEDIVEGYLTKHTMPILYMGDNKQLNPVKEHYSPVFYKDYPVVTLTQIVRQGATNPIIELSNDTDLIFFKEPHIVEGKGYVYSDARDQFIESLAEANGCDDFKYLAYTNDEIDLLNKQVRERVYGSPRKIEKGETLVFHKPFGNHFTSEELKVTELDVVTDFVSIPRKTTKWEGTDVEPIGEMDKIKMKFYRINDEVNVIHEHSEAIFANLKYDIKQKCNHEDWDFRANKYMEDKLFAQTKYNHAITVHKSQGSTYKEVVINIGNIMFNNKVDERQRMLYTAITRASNLVILNNVK